MPCTARSRSPAPVAPDADRVPRWPAISAEPSRMSVSLAGARDLSIPSDVPVVRATFGFVEGFTLALRASGIWWIPLRVILGMYGVAALGLIATRSTGLGHVDVAEAARRGITIANVPDYGSVAVAEHQRQGPGHATFLPGFRRLLPGLSCELTPTGLRLRRHRRPRIRPRSDSWTRRLPGTRSRSPHRRVRRAGRGPTFRGPSPLGFCRP